MSEMLNDGRSGPASPHEAGLEQVEEKPSAEASSSNLDDTTTSQDQDTTVSKEESLKRKVPDDGFDEANVRIFSSCDFVASEFSHSNNRRNLDTPMLVSMDECLHWQYSELIWLIQNLANIYPNKRSRTPSSESDNRRVSVSLHLNCVSFYLNTDLPYFLDKSTGCRSRLLKFHHLWSL
jgi:hypothetical protein